MSIDLYRYGDTKYIAFKLVNSSGDGVNNILQAGDVWISQDTGSGFSAAAQVSNLPQLIDANDMPGCYSWLPTIAETTCQAFMVNIKDQTAPAAFIENSFVIACGGNSSAFFDGD